MKKHLKTIAASVSALCIAASLCTSLTAGAVSFWPKTVMTKSSNMWNSYRNQTIHLDYCTSKEDYQDYLYEPMRNIRAVSTSSAPGHTVNVNYNDVLGAYTGSYEYWQAAQCGLYTVEKAYDFYQNLGYSRGGIYVAINDHATYTPNGNGGERENSWALGDTIFFGLGSSDPTQNGALRFLGTATDVATHEFTHIVTQDKVGWDSYNLPTETAALMEAYSDIMAELADEKNDWKIGTSVLVQNGTNGSYYSLRDLTNPGQTHNPRTPGVTYYSNYNTWKNYCNTHPNANTNVVTGSTVLSHAAYLMHDMGFSDATLAKIWLKSLDKYNSSTVSHATFSDCRNAFFDAAVDVLSKTGGRYYLAQVFSLMEAFNEVGITG